MMAYRYCDTCEAENDAPTVVDCILDEYCCHACGSELSLALEERRPILEAHFNPDKEE